MISPADRRRARARRRRLWWGVFFLAAAAAVGLGTLYSLATYRPPAPPPPVRTVAPEEAQRAVRRVAQQVREVRQRSRETRAPAPYRLRVRSEEVEAYLAAHPVPAVRLPAGVERVSGVRVAFEQGSIRVNANVTAGGRELYLTVSGRVMPDGAGGITFAPGEMRVGRLPVPAALRAEVTGRLQQQLAQLVAELGVSVASTECTDGTLVIQDAIPPDKR